MVCVLERFFCFCILRRLPRSTRTATLFPYATRFRAVRSPVRDGAAFARKDGRGDQPAFAGRGVRRSRRRRRMGLGLLPARPLCRLCPVGRARKRRSEEHTSELQSLMRISYAVFCLKKKKVENRITPIATTHIT